MSVTVREIETQPALWRQSAGAAAEAASKLPAAGERIAVVGCGTSYYIAQAVAVLRESLGLGESDAFAASEMPTQRPYDCVVAISRSGTTTEVARALAAVPDTTRTLAISAVADTPVVEQADDAVLLEFADETSIVQTRFATAALALMRGHFGQSLDEAVSQAQAAVSDPLPADPADFEHFVFLGHGWSVG
ncbi:MAG: SIS domain-containing protein, partial [Solirubrobacteraceae bacterium]